MDTVLNRLWRSLNTPPTRAGGRWNCEHNTFDLLWGLWGLGLRVGVGERRCRRSALLRRLASAASERGACAPHAIRSLCIQWRAANSGPRAQVLLYPFQPEGAGALPCLGSTVRACRLQSEVPRRRLCACAAYRRLVGPAAAARYTYTLVPRTPLCLDLD